MAHFSKTLRVPYTPEQSFSLVSDIARYPDFIKWITAMRVSDIQVEEGTTTCLGDAIVGFKGFSERFSTRVVSDSEERIVTASLVKGPFRKLRAQWRIGAVGDDGSDVTLDIEYAFRNRMLDLLAAANHSMAVDKILGAFLAEAERRFGTQVAEPIMIPRDPTSSEVE